MKIGAILLVVFTALILWSKYVPTSTEIPSIDIQKAVIIDVRSPGEFAGGHVEGAINLPIESITEADILKVAKKDQPIVLYCHSGGRASIVKNQMTQWGFSSVRNLKTQSGVQQALNQK